jgi:hypothetical protein
MRKCVNIFVIPAKAGIRHFQCLLDPDFRRDDVLRNILKIISAMTLCILSSCSAGINAPTAATPDEGPGFDAKVNTSSSTYTLSSESYKMQVRFPVVFPETEVKGNKFTVEVK